MTWLGGWLHELILVVLMAAFVEMLLPSKSMERYARLVLSLLILLAMLSPLISLLKGDASKELSAAVRQQENSGWPGGGKGKGGESLDQILADGRRLAAGARDQSLKLAAEEIAGQMRDQIAGSTGAKGVKVTVALGMGKNPEAPLGQEVPGIISVTVVLPPPQGSAGSSTAGAAGGSGTEGSPIHIEPVKPVQISLEDSSGDGSAGQASPMPEDSVAAGAGSGGNDTRQASEADAEAGNIIRLLEENWNLDPGQIKVQSTGADTVKS
ncbi:stage III sporulation protein AF [Paenibacillus piscarius]|uniref:stage III sporulation protein AF n=1 Tax=Paenibacillus piscarius TaxID=1089681 RepID=UPI001EE9A093|nr:stage III sporulation protein AF [Paenibacillus piscarius]